MYAPCVSISFSFLLHPHATHQWQVLPSCYLFLPMSLTSFSVMPRCIELVRSPLIHIFLRPSVLNHSATFNGSSPPWVSGLTSSSSNALEPLYCSLTCNAPLSSLSSDAFATSSVYRPYLTICCAMQYRYSCSSPCAHVVSLVRVTSPPIFWGQTNPHLEGKFSSRIILSHIF